ncbi:MAG: hypothetical protein QW244_00200 [Candidatus Pacearchaeota archaeon]
MKKEKEDKEEKDKENKRKKISEWKIEWKIPPRIKILEALGAIADKRIKIEKINRKVEASCISSEGDRKYKIIYDKEKNAIVSDDNGSRFKGYLGYPSIALLMLVKSLSFDKKLADALKGIQWKKLNEKFKNYFKVEFVVKQIVKKKGVLLKHIDNFIEKVLEEIREKKFKVLV